MGEESARASRPHRSSDRPPAGALRRLAGDQLRTRILCAIEEYWREHLRPPTIREIATAVDIDSTGHVAYHVGILERQGRVSREPGRSRGLMSTRPAGLPVLGTIAAGEPLDQFDAGELELLDLRELGLATPAPTPTISAHAAGEVYVLQVRGTSMIEDGILDGDYVLIVPGSTFANGAIVVAVQNSANGGRGAATLKRAFVRPDGVLLQPANAALTPRFIPSDEWDREWTVQGTVVSVYRQYVQPAPRTAAS